MIFVADLILGLMLVAVLCYVLKPEGETMFGRYTKTITALVGAAIAFATLVITSEAVDISSSEWLSGAIGLATALGVYAAANSTE